MIVEEYLPALKYDLNIIFKDGIKIFRVIKKKLLNCYSDYKLHFMIYTVRLG